MIAAIFTTMWLKLWRDKGALVLAFILPGFIFAVFAAIFSNAAGGRLDIRTAIAVDSSEPISAPLAALYADDPALSKSFHKDWREADIIERVRLGQDDVGFVIQGNLGNPNHPAIKIIKDPSREVAASVLKGYIRETLSAQNGANKVALFDDSSALGAQEGPSDQSVTYYVGGVAILFLLFSAMQGAALTLDERKSGICDRILPGSAHVVKMLFGKFLFLLMIGTLQALIIVAVANIFFDVPVSGRMGGIMLACISAAALASSLAILVASLCNTAGQMNTVSTFIVLLCSAVGGSMVPRFMMPEWLQNIGKATPNHWAIEGFYGVLARGQSIAELWLVWLIIWGATIAALLFAILTAYHMRRL